MYCRLRGPSESLREALKTFLRDYLGIFPKRHTAAAASIVGHHQGHLHYKSSFGANKEYLGHADTLLSVTLVLDIKLTLGDPEHCVIWMSERVLACMKFQGGGA